ncbi:LuxR family transcriptional regulator [Corynebacterium sp. 3HC-13]|uniref:LuxR C-terminal-related transcriptional regulator n=1 Tax=Corynebacterium poyangense TaxID=2684405 RepID=UPI001CCCD372|nr:LuxR C-terminal-related transcriptional regulator [Corynebacterium poyangense]MBZ8178270.1 LuxR family transcriptional regulator [Corynebacterium poyangense]
MSLPLGTPSQRHSPLKILLEKICQLKSPSGFSFLATGPSGCGKSRLIQELSQELYGWSITSVRILSWNSAQEKGIAGQIFDEKSTIEEILQRIDHPGSSSLFIIDDAHKANQQTVYKLLEISQAVKHSRIAVGFVADEELIATHNNKLSELVDTHIRIPPLSLHELHSLVLELFSFHLSRSAALDLHNITAGNPKRILEVLYSEPIDYWRQENPIIPLPSSWRTSFFGKLGHYASDPEILSVLQALAIFPQGANPEAMESLVGPEAISKVDAAIDMGLVEMHSPLLRLAFRQSTDRAVAQSLLGPVKLSKLHKAASRFYHSLGQIDLELYHEARAVQGKNDALAYRLAERGRELGNRGQWRKAADSLSLASSLFSSEQDARESYLDGIEALIAASDVPEARSRSKNLYFEKPDAKTDSIRAYLALHEGQKALSTQLLSRAWNELDGNPDYSDALKAQLASRMALLHLNNWDLKNILKWTDIAKKWAPPESSMGKEAHYISLIAQGALSGKIPEDIPFPDESPILAQRRHMALGWLSLVHDDPIGALHHLNTPSEGEGSERIGVWLDAWLGRTYFVLGRWDDGIKVVERGLARAERFGIHFLEPLLLWTGASIATYRGESWLAQNYSSRLAFSHDTFPLQQIPSAMCRLLISSLRNDFPSVMRAGAKLESLGKTVDMGQPGFWPWEDVWAQQLIHAGRISEADRVTSEAEERLLGSNILSSRAKLGVPRGSILILQGKVEEGLRVFEDSVECVESLALPAYESRILYEYGLVLRRLGKRRRADEIFSRAAEIYHMMGVSDFVDRCNRERRASGIGTRTRDIGKLTPQEEEIAKLVASGATNREIAGELYLSTKTVEYHLTRVYRKLGIRARTELPKVFDSYVENTQP